MIRTIFATFRHHVALIYGLSGAALLWAALPPIDLWPLAWVAPLPWAMLIRRHELGGKRPYAALTFAGFCFWLAALHWLRLPHPATSLGWVALAFYFAFYLPVFVGLSRVAVHRLRIPLVLAAPAIWTGLELARAHLLTGMTMASLGHTQHRWIQLIQLSDITGAYSVSFVVMFVAGSLACMFRSDQRRATFWPVACAAVTLAAVLVYGQYRIKASPTAPGPRVALIQGSTDIRLPASREEADAMISHIFAEYCDLSRQAVRRHPNIDLLVWPETMFRYPLIAFEPNVSRPADFKGADSDEDFRRQLSENDQGSRRLLAELAKSLAVPLLVGIDRWHFDAAGRQCFNSVAYAARDGQLKGLYDKMHLVMFGEYIPFARRLPWLYRLTPLTGSATPGERPAAFEVHYGPGKSCRVAPNICYETVLPHVIRSQVNALSAAGREPDILINLTNDGWFRGSSELDMHLACGVFRAVECRKPLLIAANTGFSAWIDSNGRVLWQGPRRAAAFTVAEPSFDGQRRSWYLAHGDWFAGLCLSLCVLCGLIGLRGSTASDVAMARGQDSATTNKG